MTFQYSFFSDKGPYPENQDSVGLIAVGDAIVACVADGVGGASHGREAASLASDFFCRSLDENFSNPPVSVVQEINSKLLAAGASGFITTFSGILIQGYRLLGGHAGDTRVCILRGNGIKQITEDHTEYFRFYKEGKLTPEVAAVYPRKHVIENALGAGVTPRVDPIDFSLERGDRVLLTTDGVHGVISKKQLRDISKASTGINDFVASVVAELQSLKPTDNYTIVAIEIS